MSHQFPKTIKAAEASERSQWAVGDALLAEVEDRQTGPRGLQAVLRELVANGLEYSIHTLRGLRVVSEAFPPDRRHPQLAWRAHREAGNPDTLDTIVRSARKSGDKVTSDYINDVVRQQRRELRDEHNKEAADAQREAAKAEADERKAQEAERDATTADERDRAKRRRKEAARRRKEATETAKRKRALPARKNRPAPAEDEVSMMVVVSTLMANCSEAEHLATRTDKMLAKDVNELSPKMIAGLTEAAMSVANAWTRVAATLRKASPAKRSHLSVVNE